MEEKRMEIIKSENPDIMIPSYGYIEELDCYIFIFEEEINKPHIHLINIEQGINLPIRLDVPYYYEGHCNLLDKNKLTIEQKKIFNEWMNKTSTDIFGNINTNWKKLRLLYPNINYKFEDNNDNFNWNEYFPKESPNYTLLQ